MSTECNQNHKGSDDTRLKSPEQLIHVHKLQIPLVYIHMGGTCSTDLQTYIFVPGNQILWTS